MVSEAEQLADLTSMLPGADSTDGTAWGFLLQLADRISPMSQVTAEIQLDPNFDVDFRLDYINYIYFCFIITALFNTFLLRILTVGNFFYFKPTIKVYNIKIEKGRDF